MHLVIGVDEAGYGPNLGPLVIAATAWGVKDDRSVISWHELLQPEIVARPSSLSGDAIVVGDSKRLFSSGNSLVGLERTLAFFADECKLPYSSCGEFLKNAAENAESQLGDAVWLRPNDDLEGVERLEYQEFIAKQSQTREKLSAQGIKFLGVQLCVVGEPAFNSGVQHHGNKATLLTFESLKLARRLLEKFGSLHLPVRSANVSEFASVKIYFDKHGGRAKYAAALSACWPELFFTIAEEGRLQSRYNIHGATCSTSIEFVAKGDSMMPCALASMYAKWTREIFMRRLNAFWQAAVPNLEATAGYPVDAKRFAAEIAHAAKKLGLKKEFWWRQV